MHQSPVLQQWTQISSFWYSIHLIFFKSFASISYQSVNILDVETCRTFTWVMTPFKEWTNLKCNENGRSGRVEKTI